MEINNPQWEPSNEEQANGRFERLYEKLHKEMTGMTNVEFLAKREVLMYESIYLAQRYFILVIYSYPDGTLVSSIMGEF